MNFVLQMFPLFIEFYSFVLISDCKGKGCPAAHFRGIINVVQGLCELHDLMKGKNVHWN